MQLSFIMFYLSFARGHALTAGSPVEQVVNLLTSMKADVEAEGKEDDKAYKEYTCWCSTNKEDHTNQVEAQKAEIGELQKKIESDVTRQATLESQIESDQKAISEHKASIAELTAMREQEAIAHQDEAADMKETIDLLDQAIKTLAPVQLLQTSQRKSRSAPGLNFNATGHGLHDKVGRYENVMKRDLWELVASARKLLGNDAGLRSDMRALNQQALRGVSGSPQEVPAGVPGAKDYYSQSDPVYGTLSQIKSDTEEDLAEAVAAEEAALESFQNVTAAKAAMIESTTSQVEANKEELYSTRLQVVESKHDLELTEKALAKDEKFLLDLEEACASSADEYKDRSETRTEEIRALAEAIGFLTGDDARDLFASSLSFFQARQHQKSQASTSVAASVTLGGKAAAQQKAMRSAQQHVLKTARRHKNLALAAQVAGLKLDSFTKVKEMMGKMMADLEAQRQAEEVKRDTCAKDMDLTNDSITAKTWEKEDLETKSFGLANDMGKLDEEIDALNVSVLEGQVTLKGASEERKKENMIFQKAVADQRATINILEKTLERLDMFYSQRLDLLQDQQQDPVKNDPPAVQKYTPQYKKQETGGAVELMRIIITDATKMDTELTVTEQNAQNMYAKVVSDCYATAAAQMEAIGTKSIERQKVSAALKLTKSALVTNQEELDTLVGVLRDQHADCDWLLQYFSARQTALAEEIESIRQAKDILSGAKFS